MKRYFTLSTIGGVIGLFFVTTLGGCKATPAPSVGFADASMMKSDPAIPFNKSWSDPNVDRHRYDTIYVAEVNTSYMLKMTDWQQGERKAMIEQDVHTLAVYMRNSIMKAFREDPKHRFRVVDVPTHDSHTVELEMALIEVVPSKVVLNVLGYAPFYVGTGISAVRTIANDRSSAAFEARLRDSGTGQIVMLAADREAQQFAPVDLRGLTWYSDAEGIIDDWSSQFVLIANRKPDEKIAPTPTFRLLPGRSPEFSHIGMTDSRIKNRHNLIERFRGGQAESLDLYFFYHLEISFGFPNDKKTWAQSCNCSAGLDGKSSKPNF